LNASWLANFAADVGGYSLLVGADKRARQLHS
jgi:hypothetical protein